MGDDHFIRPDNDQERECAECVLPNICLNQGRCLLLLQEDIKAFDSDKWERMATLVAQRLAAFRCGPDLEPIHSEDDVLRAGVIIGALWTKGFIDF